MKDSAQVALKDNTRMMTTMWKFLATAVQVL